MVNFAIVLIALFNVEIIAKLLHRFLNKKNNFLKNIQLFEPDEMTQAKIHILISYYGI